MGERISLNDNPGTQRANEILEVIMAYARLDFTTKTRVTGTGDVLDAISAGVNMLGEELKSSTVSLREKEQLLKEVHHRVKNNLQIVYSLLNLQSDFITDEKHLHVMRESRNRIKSMALVHEMLYASNDLSSISLGGYIKSLIQHLSFTYVQPKQHIDFTVAVDSHIHFQVDQMIPLGLILNEVVTNSLKYAFPQNEGNISIVAQCRPGYIVLEAGDNGTGLPPEFDLLQQANLGMQLIHMLCEQLDAKLAFNSNEGLRYTIEIPA